MKRGLTVLVETVVTGKPVGVNAETAEGLKGLFTPKKDSQPWLLAWLFHCQRQWNRRLLGREVSHRICCLW